MPLSSVTTKLRESGNRPLFALKLLLMASIPMEFLAGGQAALAQVYVQPAQTVPMPGYARTVEMPAYAQEATPIYPDSSGPSDSAPAHKKRKKKKKKDYSAPRPASPGASGTVPQFWQQTYSNGNYNPYAVPGW